MSFSYCADESLGIGEPLAGSAIAAVDRFVVIEHDAPWGPKGVEDSELPPAVLTWLMDLGQRHRRLRVQLVRRTDAATSAPRRVWFAETGEGAVQLRMTRLARLDELCALEVDAWLRDAAEAPGEPDPEPLYLVCVHGKRDRCCARLGLPLFRALAEVVGERVLQTTHLGGHRFAATLLVLPMGVCYGRVDATEAEALVAATRRGELHDLARVRGRTAYPIEAQAAEVALREELAERRADALRLAEIASPSPDLYRVRFVSARGEHEVSLRREALPPSPASCGAAPKAGRCLVPLRTSGPG